MPAVPIPQDFRCAIAMLAVRDADRAIRFYQEAFGARELSERRIVAPNDKIGHAEFMIGPARIMIADEFPGENHSPQSLGGTSVILCVYVEDVDALFERANKAGVKVIRPPADQPYGRVCKLEDPFGHVWIFGMALV